MSRVYPRSNAPRPRPKSRGDASLKARSKDAGLSALRHQIVVLRLDAKRTVLPPALPRLLTV